MNLDINLLPKSKKRLTGIDALLLALIIIGILALLAYFAFYAPINHKKTLEKQIEDRKIELEKVTKDVEEYTSLLENVAVQKDKNNTISSIKDSYILNTTLLEDIEMSLHKSISITDIRLTQSNIVIKGISDDYDNIAQSIVNLREKDYFVTVKFNVVELKEDAEESKQYYTFDMSINLAKSIDDQSLEEDSQDVEQEVENKDEA
ncbi:MAG: PilN domain-containing protein [Clostridiales bacterium]|jgi:Tfp pilus assembly protein PilN|nr:PilN domain-containing protein [Clostridiales bacterium]